MLLGKHGSGMIWLLFQTWPGLPRESVEPLPEEGLTGKDEEVVEIKYVNPSQ